MTRPCAPKACAPTACNPHRRSALLGLSALATLPLAACSPTRWINGQVPDDTHDRVDGVAYGQHPLQRLDIYRPLTATGLPPGGPGAPVVVFFYGGSWRGGSRSTYRFVGEALASRGIVTLVADYRVYPEVTFPGFLDDSAQAVAWALREAARLGGDPKRLVVMGHSAGGYNAAMVALDARWLRPHGAHPGQLAGWAGLAGPYDFLPILNPRVRPVFLHPDYPPGSQPIDKVTPASPPAFIAAAAADGLVNPQRNAQQMARRLREAGVPVTERLYERANHLTLIGAMSRPLRWVAPVLDDVTAFVQGVPASEHPVIPPHRQGG